MLTHTRLSLVEKLVRKKRNTLTQAQFDFRLSNSVDTTRLNQPIAHALTLTPVTWGVPAEVQLTSLKAMP